jgi:hypothetical protein
LNPAAVKLAEHLIEEGDYRINSVWREARPSDASQEDFLDRNGFDLLSQWYLGVDTSAEPGTKASLKFPIGDYKNVHRSAIAAARGEADRAGAGAVAEAADELIFYFDRITAC